MTTPFSRFTITQSTTTDVYTRWQYKKELPNPVTNMTYDNFLSVTSSFYYNFSGGAL